MAVLVSLKFNFNALFQLGHEPLQPVFRRNMYFRKQLQYPNVFQYCKYYYIVMICYILHVAGSSLLNFDID